jgi:hypothetical protein
VLRCNSPWEFFCPLYPGTLAFLSEWTKRIERKKKGKSMWGFYQSAEAACLESSPVNGEIKTRVTVIECQQPTAAGPDLKKDWRFYSGMAALILAGVLPLFSMLVPLLGLPTAWAVTLVACFIGGGPEVLLLVAAALLGKETVHHFLTATKNWAFRVLSIRPAASQA